MKSPLLFIALIVMTWAVSCSSEPELKTPFEWTEFSIDQKMGENIKVTSTTPVIYVKFNKGISFNTSAVAISLIANGGAKVPIEIATTDDGKSLLVTPKSPLIPFTTYDFLIDNQLASIDGSILTVAFAKRFMTPIDLTTDKLPRLSDNALMDTIQRRTFAYFWEFGHPVSGMSRERNSSGDIVTSGGTGFGVMSILVAIERGWISREAGLTRLLKMTDFLTTKAERFHGAYSHWLNGATGKAIPFSAKDDGGDLVETSYLMAGLLAAQEYFNGTNAQEVKIRQDIKALWEAVEWSWYTQGGKDVLYWHWSPKFAWQMNHQIRGWNETLITYILAASSPTYPISRKAYDAGFAINGAIKNGKTFYNHFLPLGPDQGGSLFFAQYTFLTIDPRNLKDAYADYWTQNVNHSKINHAYCVSNPRNYQGYSADCWGLTASDNHQGYDAHSPTNDLGVITPTAALSSFPYTPVESKRALEFFYYKMGDRLFREYGLVDAFNLSKGWIASSTLAIDQGPIIVMMENHRSGLLWKLGMRHPDVQNGLTKLGFTY